MQWLFDIHVSEADKADFGEARLSTFVGDDSLKALFLEEIPLSRAALSSFE